MLFNFSWLIENKLAGCNCPGRIQFYGGHSNFDMIKDFLQLKENGIDVIVSVLEKLPRNFLEQCKSNNIENLHFSIVDYNVPKDINAYSNFINEIINRMQNGKKVMVHCKAGVGRTGLTLACIVGRIHKLNAEKAIEAVRSIRPYSIESMKQIQFVQMFLDGKISETKLNGVFVV